VAHNVSREKQERALAAVTPRRSLAAGWKVTLYCAGCVGWQDPDYQELSLRDLLDQTWRSLAKKRRCLKCNELGASVRFDWGREHIGVLRNEVRDGR
jgi:hypothetical protein